MSIVKRLRRLEQVVEAKRPPIRRLRRWLDFDPDRTAAEYLMMARQQRHEMVSRGEIGKRDTVTFVRWLSRDERERACSSVAPFVRLLSDDSE